MDQVGELFEPRVSSSDGRAVGFSGLLLGQIFAGIGREEVWQQVWQMDDLVSLVVGGEGCYERQSGRALGPVPRIQHMPRRNLPRIGLR